MCSGDRYEIGAELLCTLFLVAPHWDDGLEVGREINIHTLSSQNHLREKIALK